jgi:hypothetical protein
MKRLAIATSTVILLSALLASSASATPRLTMGRAQRVIADYGAQDGPRAVLVNHCTRMTRVRINCQLTEYHEPITTPTLAKFGIYVYVNKRWPCVASIVPMRIYRLGHPRSGRFIGWQIFVRLTNGQYPFYDPLWQAPRYEILSEHRLIWGNGPKS